MTDPSDQVKKGVIQLCGQFILESDLSEQDIVQAVVNGLNEWLEDDVIEFTPDV
jgi:hypothetical protein